MARGAAAVIVGNELLTGKIQDENGALLIRRLRACGIPLRSLHVVPDEVDAIVQAVAQARSVADHVFTSGGIGPTHDDVTVRAVALALGRRIVRSEEMSALIRTHWESEPPPATFRLADMPQGAELWKQEGLWFPVLTCDRVYVLPGVPQLFRIQIETVLARMEKGQIHLRALYLRSDESDIAGALDSVALAMPEVQIGSYPTFDRALDYRVKITVEHALAAPVDDAVARLLVVLPAGALVRME